ncbi:MAG: flavodoxin family protein [Nanoarchaeota archaeon]|nr:flavodoxin family protein [Nanoarchaeota archaeon]
MNIKKMKLLAICGSPRKGNTEFMLNKVLEGAGNVDKELILLRNLDIKHCIGCCVCEKAGKCPIEDDMQEILKKLEEADAIVIGSPTYFDNVTGLLKNFMDRMHPLYNKFKLKNKKFAVISTGSADQNSIKGTIDNLKKFGEIMKMNLVGTVSVNDKHIKDEEVINELKKLGQKLK